MPCEQVTLKTRVHAAVYVPIAVAVLVILVVSLTLPSNARSDSLKLSRPQLLNSKLMETQTRLGSVAQEIDSQFRDVSSRVSLAANHTDSGLAVRSPFARVYWARTNADTSKPPKDLENYPMQGAHFKRQLTSYAQLYALPYLNQTDLSVMIMRPILKAEPKIDQIYIAFDDDHIFWMEREWGVADDYETGRFLSGCSGAYEVGYQPHCDPWFLSARANPGKLVYAPPYFDSNAGKLVVSIATTLSTIPGVLGADLNMGLIDETVTQLRMTDQGYTFLVQKSNGYVITHPRLNRTANGPVSISTLESTWPLNWTQTLTNPLLVPRLLQRSSGEEWYVACADVAIPKYVSCTVFPKSDATASGDRLANESSVSLSIALGVLIPFTILMMVGIYFTNEYAVKPTVVTLEQMAQQLEMVSETKGKIDISRPLYDPNRYVPATTELVSLQLAVDQLVAACRVNQSATTIDQRRHKLARLQEALNTWTAAKNRRGVGLCQSEAGQLKFKLGEPNLNEAMDEAIRYMQAAVETSRSLVGSQENKAQECDRLALATRLDNLGVLFMNRERFTESKAAFQESLQRHQELDNAEGVAFVSVNISLWHLKAAAQLDQHKAKEFVVGAEKALTDAEEFLGHSPLAKTYIPHILAQRAYILANHRNDSVNAQRIYSQIKTSFERLDSGLIQVCDDGLTPHIGSGSAERQVLFVLDLSGSMAGGKIRAAKESLQGMIGSTQLFGDNDQICLLTFSTNVYPPSFEFMPRGPINGQNHRLMSNIIDNVTVGGVTALYRALGDSFQLINNKKAADDEKKTLNTERHVFVLTDGENSEDPTTVDGILSNPPPAANVKLFMVGPVNADADRALRAVARHVKGTYDPLPAGAEGILAATQQIKKALAPGKFTSEAA